MQSPMLEDRRKGGRVMTTVSLDPDAQRTLWRIVVHLASEVPDPPRTLADFVHQRDRSQMLLALACGAVSGVLDVDDALGLAAYRDVILAELPANADVDRDLDGLSVLGHLLAEAEL